MDKNNSDVIATFNKELALLYYELYIGCIDYKYNNKTKVTEEIDCDKYYKELEKIGKKYYKVTK